jgi:hypothetical protein
VLSHHMAVANPKILDNSKEMVDIVIFGKDDGL